MSALSTGSAAAPEPAPPFNLPVGAEPVQLELTLVLQALSDPVRLAIVMQLADGLERNCSCVEVPVSKSTCSHHLRVLRECGLIETRVDGKARLNRLRAEAIELQLPGLLTMIKKVAES